jgi:hypothetical protein
MLVLVALSFFLEGREALRRVTGVGEALSLPQGTRSPDGDSDRTPIELNSILYKFRVQRPKYEMHPPQGTSCYMIKGRHAHQNAHL